MEKDSGDSIQGRRERSPCFLRPTTGIVILSFARRLGGIFSCWSGGWEQENGRFWERSVLFQGVKFLSFRKSGIENNYLTSIEFNMDLTVLKSNTVVNSDQMVRKPLLRSIHC